MDNKDYYYALEHQYDDDGFTTNLMVYRFKTNQHLLAFIEHRSHTASACSLRHHVVDAVVWNADNGNAQWLADPETKGECSPYGTYDTLFT